MNLDAKITIMDSLGGLDEQIGWYQRTCMHQGS